MNRCHLLTAAALALAAASLASAHDTWVQTNTQVVRIQDVVHVDLMLGNHGNDHRDYRLAGKVKLPPVTLQVIDPKGQAADLKPRLTDQGLSESEGYWTAMVKAGEPGLYTLAHTYDAVVSYAPKRSIKSAKAYFVAALSLDRVPLKNPGFDKPLGHALELVPLTSPVTPMGPGESLKVKLLYKGKPLIGSRVSFVPRGARLSEGFDDRYERTTDDQGVASFEFRDANYYLITAHHEDTADKGDGYESTKYSAALSVIVPAICPCCD